MATSREFGNGKARLVSTLGDFAAKLDREAKVRAAAAGNVLRRHWLHTLSGERHGRYYRIPGTHRAHQSGSKRRMRAQNPIGGWQPGAEMEQGAASLLSTASGAAGRRGFYRASAPGEPPARRLGDLARSITVKLVKIARGRYRVIVGSEESVVGLRALLLEEGTAHMAPRPHLRPSLDASRGEIRDIMEAPIR